MVSELVMKDYLIEKIAPPYPRAARVGNVQGEVVLEALIDKDGSVKKIDTVAGQPVLAAAATEALQRWRYRPYPNQENPIPVQTLVKFNFRLKPAATVAKQTGPAPAQNVYSRKDGVSAPRATYRPDPPYTEQARKAGLQGSVDLQIVVNGDGTVGAAKLLKGLGMGLDQSAESTVRKWKFKPGLKDGKPVAVRVVVTVNFILQR